MRWSPSFLATVTCGLLVSCATPALWDATNPHEFVVVSQSKVNEQELKAKGLDYYTDPERPVFYVEKNGLQKTRDYVIRALGTPVTVTLDTATTIAVVGTACYLLSHDRRTSAEREAGRIEAQRKEMEAQRKEMELIDKILDDIRLQERESPNHASEAIGAEAAPQPQR